MGESPNKKDRQPLIEAVAGRRQGAR